MSEAGESLSFVFFSNKISVVCGGVAALQPERQFPTGSFDFIYLYFAYDQESNPRRLEFR